MCDKSELERGIIEFNRAIELNPRFVLAYANRGLALLRQGKDAEAMKDFERVVELDPTLKTEVELKIEMVKKWRRENPAVKK